MPLGHPPRLRPGTKGPGSIGIGLQRTRGLSTSQDMTVTGPSPHFCHKCREGQPHNTGPIMWASRFMFVTTRTPQLIPIETDDSWPT
jgi:hypothetical protein